MSDSRIKRFLQGLEKPGIKVTVILLLVQLVAAVCVMIAILKPEGTLSWVLMFVGLSLVGFTVAITVIRMHYGDKQRQKRMQVIMCLDCDALFYGGLSGLTSAADHLSETSHSGFRFAYYNQVTQELVE